MRVSIDCRYIRERPSGIGNYVRALVDRLPALAPKDHFLFWTDPRASRPLTAFDNVTESVVRVEANSVPTLLWPGKLVDLSGVEVLHLPYNLLGRGIPCPTVVTLHDLIWLLAPVSAEGRSIATPFQALFYRNGIQRALARATRIVAISEATAESIALVSPEARRRVRVVRHGVEPRFRPAESPEKARERAAAILGTGAPYFLVVGQNAPYKQHDRILEAFAAAELGAEIRLVLLQRLRAGGRLHARARHLGITDRLHWRGGLADDEVVALLHGALALVQFSRFEGFGMPALEALACGTPVIASRISALVEVLGGAGLVVGDVAELARTLRRVAGEPILREELSQAGIERARAFSWDRSASEHLEVLREAAASGRPSS